jgi:hypothetical protein
VFFPATVTSGAVFLGTFGSSGQYLFYLYSGGNIHYSNVDSFTAGIQAYKPYLFITSYNDTTKGGYAILRNLATGRTAVDPGPPVITGGVGGPLPMSSGAIYIGGYGASSIVGAALFSGLTFAAALQLADAPWDYWFPPSALETLWIGGPPPPPGLPPIVALNFM